MSETTVIAIMLVVSMLVVAYNRYLDGGDGGRMA